MCDCIKKNEEQLCQKTHDGRKILKAEFENIGFTLGKNINANIYQIFQCQVEGRKRPVPIKVLNSHCPFCGEQIKKDE
ncbi:MAG TPA: hypothetical protein PL045_01285 [Chitinophagaceae bacterium]|nr:hypothetical protein [Chitinophagaceae bacterium]